MNDTVLPGGFFHGNIREWIQKECIESGKPKEFFYNVSRIVREIEQEAWNDPAFWEKLEKEYDE